MKFILGKKLQMSQIFQNGIVVPVTLIEAGPCFITQIKNNEKDGYQALQVGLVEKKRKIKKSEKGKEYKHIREFRLPSDFSFENLKNGEKIDVSVFEENDMVKISGQSKGKGFQGGVKRWGFHGRNATHGTKHEERTIGSIGAGGPQRVMPGKKMPGHMGDDRTTVANLQIVKIDKENNLLAVKGAVPGRRGVLLEIRG